MRATTLILLAATAYASVTKHTEDDQAGKLLEEHATIVEEMNIDTALLDERNKIIADMPDQENEPISAEDVLTAYNVKKAVEGHEPEDYELRRKLLGELFDSHNDVSVLNVANGEIARKDFETFLSNAVEGTVTVDVSDPNSIYVRFKRDDGRQFAMKEYSVMIAGLDFRTLDREQFVMLTMPLFEEIFGRRIEKLEVRVEE